MILVRFFAPFCSSTQLKTGINACFYMDPTKITVTDGEDYTHAVVINNGIPADMKTLPKENVLGLAWEPPFGYPFLNLSTQFIQWCEKHVGMYYIGERGKLGAPFVEHFGYLTFPPPPKEITPKTKIMSIIFSRKNITQGHRYRNQLVSGCLQRGFPIDVWGRGCQYIQHKSDSRIKGEFSANEPYDGYLFSIAVENCSINDYITEKFVQCLANRTIPLYFGAKSIEKYFPNSCFKLSGKLEQDMELIRSILMEPLIWAAKINVDNYPKLLNEWDLGRHLVKLWGQ